MTIPRNYDEQYIDICREIISIAENSENLKNDRTGVGCYSTFAKSMTHDLSDGFPLLISKFTAFKAMATELMFFMRGLTDNNWLVERGCNIWTPWADEDGELGPIYGSQLRNFNNQGFDQLEYVTNLLLNNPDSRRIQFTYYNPLVLPNESLSHEENIRSGKAVLPPCHVLYNFHVETVNGVRKLNGSLTQRSADMPLGVPFNFSQLALWVEALAHRTNLVPGKIHHLLIDAHIYSNQIEQMKKVIANYYVMLDRIEYPDYPKLKILADRDKELYDYNIEDFLIEDYKCLGKFNFPVAV